MMQILRIPESRVLVLKSCRHPVLEALPEAPPFIPNDVLMGENPEGRILVTNDRLTNRTMMRVGFAYGNK